MMKKLMMLAAMAAATLPIMAETEVVDGIEWTYDVFIDRWGRPRDVSVGGGSSSQTAVPITTTGNLTIPATLGGYPVTSIGEYAFSSCSGLTSVTIPDSVTSIAGRAFEGCSGLTSVTIPDSVTSIDNYAFYGCSGLKLFMVAAGNPSYKSVSGLLLTKDGKTLVAGVNGDVTIPSGVTSIGYFAFDGCSGLTSVTIPDSVTSIGSWAFCGCSGLVSVTIGNGVTSIGGMAFDGCSGLTSVHVTDISKWCNILFDSYFANPLCYAHNLYLNGVKVTSLTIPDGVTSIGSYAFFGCSGLTGVTIPDSVTSIGYDAFSGCSGLTGVTIGSGVTSIGSGAFYGCDAISRVDYWCPPPANIWNLSIIGKGVQRYSREYGAQWQKVIGIANFNGYQADSSTPKVTVISSSIRVNDPTIMDVVYKVASSKLTVKVRALAFEDGERSFAKVVRPETFIEGTAANVGDEIAANVEHTLSWQVSSDWQTRLAKLKFEVLVCEGELLPMEWMTIPASDTYGKMKVSWNAHLDSQIFDALLWLYADKYPGLTLAGGVLKANDKQVASGTSIETSTRTYSSYDYSTRTYTSTYYQSAPEYIFSQMGYQTLSGEALTYVNDETRLGLSPSGARQYAYKIVEDAQ